MATEHVSIADPQIHEPKGVAAAVAGQVYVADGASSGAWAQQAAGASTVVSVETLDDFPTPVGGVITLAAETVYQINTQVDIGTNRIVYNTDSILLGIHRSVSGITSTTTAALLSATSVDMRLESLNLSTTTASKLFDFNGGGTATLGLRDVVSFNNTGYTGDITDAVFTIIDFCFFTSGTDGLKFFGTSNTSVRLTNGGWTGYTGTGLALGTATFDNFRVQACTINGDGVADTGISGAASSANINTGGTAFVHIVDVASNNIALSGITSGDLQWVFQNNSGIKNTDKNGQVYLDTFATDTTIVTQNVPVIVNGGTSWVVHHEDQFTGTTGGRLTYNGINDIEVVIHATVHGTGASGTDTFTFYIAKNGTVLDSSRAPREFVSTNQGALALIGLESISSGDYLELWVENNTSTVNFGVIDANIVIVEA